MSLLSEVLKDYFEDEATTPRSTRLGILRESKLPISANESSWEIHTDPERFSKKFKFKTRKRLIFGKRRYNQTGTLNDNLDIIEYQKRTYDDGRKSSYECLFHRIKSDGLVYDKL